MAPADPPMASAGPPVGSAGPPGGSALPPTHRQSGLDTLLADGRCSMWWPELAYTELRAGRSQEMSFGTQVWSCRSVGRLLCCAVWGCPPRARRHLGSLDRPGACRPCRVSRSVGPSGVPTARLTARGTRHNIGGTRHDSETGIHAVLGMHSLHTALRARVGEQPRAGGGK